MGEYESDLKGFAKKAVGRVEEEGGRILGDREMEVEGDAHRARGEQEEIDASLGKHPDAERDAKEDRNDDERNAQDGEP